MKHILDMLDSVSKFSGKKKTEAFGWAMEDETFKKVVLYASHPFKMYNIQKLPIFLPQAHKPADIFSLLDALAESDGASAADKQRLSAACPDEETWEVVRRIVNKDLRIGVGDKTIRKFVPDFPIHELALCGLQITWTPDGAEGEYFEDLSDWKKFQKQVERASNIMYSVKLDGVRDWATVHESGKVTHISRNGKPFKNFGKFDDQLRKFAKILTEVWMKYPVTFDAEVFSKDKSFNKIMTQVSRHGELDESTMSMGIFDLPFAEGSLDERYALLKHWHSTKDVWIVEHPYLSIRPGESPFAAVRRITEEAWANGEEGIVLKDAVSSYSFSRGNDWCKVVTTFSADLPVIGVKEGTGKYTGLLGALIVDFKGKAVDVGSGYEDTERRVFLKSPPAMIEVLYRDVTEDGSLRFPRYRRVREDK